MRSGQLFAKLRGIFDDMARTDTTLSEGVEAVEEGFQLFDYPTLAFNPTSSNTSTGREISLIP